MDGPSELVSTLDLSLVLADGPDAQAPWQVLECPLGAGQLLVDCVADALVDDGDLDCDFQGAGALADKIRAELGAPDASGCRPNSAGGGDSLDKLLDDAIAGGGTFPTGSDLTDLVAIRDAIATQLILRSSFQVHSTFSEHGLTVAELGPEPRHAIDLLETARPVLYQGSVTTTTTPSGSAAPTSNVESHGFTLDLGSLSSSAFDALALTPASLSGDALGADLVGSAQDMALSGCEAVSSVFCTAVAEASDCAETACAAASTHLDDRLDNWWQRLTSVGGIDLELSGTLSLRDLDHDLVVDTVGRDTNGDLTGVWSATMTTATSTIENVPATAATPP